MGQNISKRQSSRSHEELKGEAQKGLLTSEGVTWQNFEVGNDGMSHLAWRINSDAIEYKTDINDGCAFGVVGSILVKGKPAFRFVSQKAAIKRAEEGIRVEGRVHVQDLGAGLHLLGETLQWRPASQSLAIGGGVAVSKGTHFCLSAPSLLLTGKDAPARQTDSRHTFQPFSQVSHLKSTLGLAVPQSLAGSVELEGPAYAWIVSPSTIIGGRQAAIKQARNVVSKLIEAPAIVAQPLIPVPTKPPCLSNDGDSETSSPVDNKKEEINQGTRRSSRGRESIEIQVKAKDGLHWDLATNALSSKGSVSVWCDRLPTMSSNISSNLAG